MKKIYFPFLICTIFILSACQPATPAPTATATLSPPSATTEPTATKTAMPTSTPEPTATQEPTATEEPDLGIEGGEGLILVRTIHLPKGGFSIKVVEGYDHSTNDPFVTITNKNSEILFSVASTHLEAGQTLEEVLNNFIKNVSKDLDDFTTSEFYEYTTTGGTGIATDVTSDLFGDPATGRIAILSNEGDQIIIAFGIAIATDEVDYWLTEGELAFTLMVDSIEFSADVTDNGNCPISQDATYGVTPENPIRIGGDVFGGPSRARAYFENLRGPNGEIITYTRGGSFESDESILDLYKVTYPDGAALTIYIDHYSYEPVQAPIGLTCEAAFIGAP